MAAEDLCSDICIGGTADVEEETRVVGLRGGFRVDAHPIGKSHSEQRALQAMLERHHDAEVGRSESEAITSAVRTCSAAANDESATPRP